MSEESFASEWGTPSGGASSDSLIVVIESCHTTRSRWSLVIAAHSSSVGVIVVQSSSRNARVAMA